MSNPEPEIQEFWYCTNAACSELNVYKAAYVAGYVGVTCGTCAAVCTREDLLVINPTGPVGKGTYGSHQPR